MAKKQQRVLVRIHDSGDFFAPWYMRATAAAVAEREDWLDAYGYTKRLDLLPGISVPRNYSLLQSVGGLLDHLIDETRPHSRVFLTAAERDAAGYRDGNESDLPAVAGLSVGLVYHGTETVTEVDGAGDTSDRGSCKWIDGAWVVTMPMGIKNRTTHELVFNFDHLTDSQLAEMVTVQTGNKKVGKTARKLTSLTGVQYRVAALNAPALATCPMAGACSAFCYALQGTFGFASVRESRARYWAVLHEAYRRGGEALVQEVIGQALDTMRPRNPAPWRDLSEVA